MFRNLRAEIARKSLGTTDLATIIGLSRKSVHNRLNGKTEFTRKEMFNIQESLFKDLTLEYLFKWEDEDET